METQRHALIDAVTGLVRSVIIWNGDAWLPPLGHYVVHNCEGQIGDYWNQDRKAFYTVNGKRRYMLNGKVGEQELNSDEKEHVEPRLKEIYAHAFKRYRWDNAPDLTREGVEIPKMLEELYPIPLKTE